MKVALIDGDSILYRVGFALEEELDDGSYYVNLEEAKARIDGIIDEIMYATDTDKIELWIGGGDDNFRYKVAEENLKDNYKYNRKSSRKPDKFDEMFKYLKEEYKAKSPKGCEVDDVVVTKKTENPKKYVLCAIDKDVLNQTEGTHYNFAKGSFVTTEKDYSIWYSYYQTLVGDNTDGYKGCNRIGPKKAPLILGDPGRYNERTLWAKVLCAYRKAKQSKQEALATMRLANMHQLVRNDKGKLEVRLWTPPEKGDYKIDALPF